MNKRGFTLIEALIVVAIIGVLATTILLAMGNIRTQSRDIFRIQELNRLGSFVEIYQSDADGYPTGDCADITDATSCPNLQVLISKAIVGSLPDDPSSGKDFSYHQGTDGVWEYFIVYGYLEDAPGQGFILPGSKTDWCAANLPAGSKYYCTGGYFKD